MLWVGIIVRIIVNKDLNTLFVKKDPKSWNSSQ